MRSRWLGLALWALAWVAGAGEPPQEPILRIDPGAHTTMIRRIATDAAGRWLVTASDDKTARVWDLAAPEPRLAATLRPPLGPGNEGKLFAVAMAPDGETVAVGGWTQFNAGKNESINEFAIYLFDRASGRLIQRIAGLPNRVLHLAFAPDGRTLAATLGEGGLRLFDPTSGRPLAEDRDYGDRSYSVQFRADGRRLLTTSWDGHLRLYRWEGGQLELLVKKAAPGGKDPYAARFAPDGRRVAVGFDDSPAVNLLDGETLAFLSAPATPGVNRSLNSIAWSLDGRWLFAAGRAKDQDGRTFIRRWPMQGDRAGKPQDWPVASNTIMDLAPLPGGRLAFGGGGPAWGVVDEGGRRPLFQAPAVADFRDNREGFQLAADGGRVRFGYEYGGKAPAVFDLAARAFVEKGAPGLRGPRLEAPGLAVTDWKNTTAPRLNGRPLKLEEYETSFSLALRPGGEGLVLGTGWWLRAFDQQGGQQWEQPAPGVVWGLNVSEDGRWVVAAYGDGTIRWHRSQDGAEQLAFFPHPDKKRWVLWSPSGYYDASPGAEDLIGWHLNNGKDAAGDFFPASKFRGRFYRPDVLAQVLATGDEAKAVQSADAEAGRRAQTAPVAALLPPLARLLDPADGGRFDRTGLTLRYSARAPADAPVTGVRVLVDGRPLSSGRGVVRVEKTSGSAAEPEFSLSVELPARDLELALIAENKHGASEAARARLTWAGAKPQEFVAKPKLYLLAVGVSDYQDPALKLGYPAKDAQDFAAALQGQTGLYREVAVKLLTNPTAAQVLDGLDWLRAEVTAKDLGVLFLAGHGENDADGDYYFLPADVDPQRLRRTAVSYFEVKKTLSALPGKTLAFIDTCHAGNVMGSRRGGVDINKVVNDLTAAENGVVVFASSTGRQFSLENDAWRNGAFTKALVEGFAGQADYTKDGAVTINELDTWLADRVKQLTGNQQTPTTTKPATVPDFPVAVVK